MVSRFRFPQLVTVHNFCKIGYKIDILGNIRNLKFHQNTASESLKGAIY